MKLPVFNINKYEVQYIEVDLEEFQSERSALVFARILVHFNICRLRKWQVCLDGLVASMYGRRS